MAIIAFNKAFKFNISSVLMKHASVRVLHADLIYFFHQASLLIKYKLIAADPGPLLEYCFDSSDWQRKSPVRGAGYRIIVLSAEQKI